MKVIQAFTLQIVGLAPANLGKDIFGTAVREEEVWSPPNRGKAEAEWEGGSSPEPDVSVEENRGRPDGGCVVEANC